MKICETTQIKNWCHLTWSAALSSLYETIKEQRGSQHCCSNPAYWISALIVMTPIRRAGSNGCHRFYERQRVFETRSRTRALLTDSCTWVRRDIRRPRQADVDLVGCQWWGGVMSCPKHWPELKLSLMKDFRAVFTCCDTLQPFSTLSPCLHSGPRCSDRLINHTCSDVLLSGLAVSPHHTTDNRLTPLK